MTEKQKGITVRELCSHLLYLIENGKGDKTVELSVIDLLNELSDKNRQLEKENEQLKQRNKTLQKSINDFIKVEEENEQLKANCKNYEWYKKYKELLNENEQLKGEVTHYKLILMSLEEEAKRISSIRRSKND